jgi:hypothetical protein
MKRLAHNGEKTKLSLSPIGELFSFHSSRRMRYVSSANLAFFAGLKSRNQHICNHATSSYECDNDIWSNDSESDALIRSRNRYSSCQYNECDYRYLRNPFFIDRLRKPNLNVDALRNDTNVPESVLTSFDAIRDDVLVYASRAGNTATEHRSQCHLVTWKERNEPPSIVSRARLRIKFGVLKVTNQQRRVSRGVFAEGIATNLKAEMSVLPLGVYTIDGRWSPQDDQLWLNARALDWYKEGWQDRLKRLEGTDAATQEAINELKHIVAQPTILSQYLRNETQDILPIGDEAYLLLFYTIDGVRAWFHTFGFRNYFLGRYLLKVKLYSHEIAKPRYYTFQLDIRSWNDFGLKEVAR